MEQKENEVIAFIKKEAVLCAALLLAMISSFFIKPSVNYITYLDYRVLVLLFCLMLVVAGFKNLGIFQLLGEKLCSLVHTTRGLTFVLVNLCFFASMLITNDVSLITFIPFTLSVYAMAGCEKVLIPVVVLETIAANLGSMLTPVGNPQNLLLYSVSGMSMGDFILHMLPLTCVSYVAIVVCIFFIPDQHIILHGNQSQDTKKFLIIRMRSVNAIDATAMHYLEQLYESFHAKGIQIILSHVNEQPRSVMDKAGFTEKIGEENFCIHIDEALERAHILADVQDRLDTKAF